MKPELPVNVSDAASSTPSPYPPAVPPVRDWDYVRLGESMCAISVEPLPHHEGSQNCHFLVVPSDGAARQFVKVYASEAYARYEGTALDLVQSESIPRVVGRGYFDGHAWAAFVFTELTPFRLDGIGPARDWTTAFLDVHKTRFPNGVDLLRTPRLFSHLTKRLGRLARADQRAAQSAVRAIERVADDAERISALVEAESPCVLTHGDASLRNTFTRGGGPPFFVDYERAKIGLREFDLALAWYADLQEETLRRIFLTEYCAAIDADPEIWPDPRYMCMLGWWMAAGILPFARRVQSAEFHGLGIRILREATDWSRRLDWRHDHASERG